MTWHCSKYKQITILLEPQYIFDLIMFEAEEFDIFALRQAILGDVCNVCPSLRICAEPLPVVIQATRACLPPPWLPPTPPWRNLGGTSWKRNWHRNLCATSWKRHWHRNLRSLLTGTEIWDQSLAQKFEISSCVLKLATKNVGTRNKKMWSQKFVWLALEKGLAQKFVIQKSFHFLRRQANYFYIRWIYFGTI